jgi:L-rhamnose mutarotase
VIRRFGWVARVKPDKVSEYVALHADTWPSVLVQIEKCHLHNYSIFHKELPNGEHWLFSYWEYNGEDFENDMKRIAEDPETQRWWAECKPCLTAVEDLPPGEVWAPMQSVFFQP